MRQDYKKITQTINYLVRKDERSVGINELKIIKLVWAADRYHLRKYARLVTGDQYFAMPNGPVGSLTKDIAEFSDNVFSNTGPDEFDYISSYINFNKNNNNGILSSVNDVDYDELSETDIEALDFAWNKFGQYDWKTLIKITHEYPEWLKFKNAFESRATRREEIDLMDFFKNSNRPHDEFSETNKFVESSKELFSEYM